MQAPPIDALQAGDKLTMTFVKNPKPSWLSQQTAGGGGGVQGAPPMTPPVGPPGPPMGPGPMAGGAGPSDPKALLMAALARR